MSMTFHLDSVKHKTQSNSGQAILSHTPSGYYEIRFAGNNTLSTAFIRGYATTNKIILTGDVIDLSGNVLVNGNTIGAGNSLTGAGNSGYIVRFVSASGIGNSILSQSGDSININTSSTSGALNFADSTGIKLYLGKVGTQAFFIDLPNTTTMRFNTNGSFDFNGASIFSGSFNRVDINGASAELRLYNVGSDATALHAAVRRNSLPSCSYIYSIQGSNSGVFQSWGDLILGPAEDLTNKVVIGRVNPTYITTSGVGINRANPNYNLDVSGRINASTDILISGQSITSLFGGGTTILTGGAPSVIGNYSLSSGISSTFIPFVTGFASTPYVIGSLSNTGTEPLVSYIISGIRTSGFYVDFSTNLTSDKYNFTYLATTQLGQLAISSGNSTLTSSFLNKTGNYTMSSTDDIVLGDSSLSSFIITLPTASTSSGKLLRIKRINSGSFNIIVSGSSIDGETGIPLVSKNQSLSVISNGSGYYVF